MEESTVTCAVWLVAMPAVTSPPTVADTSLRNTDTAMPTPTLPSS
jgi:hypothetical protein